MPNGQSMTLTTSNAIAYLKPVVDDDDEPVIELNCDDTPIAKQLDTDLLVTYLVDAGESFAYIQQRDLDADSITVDQLHANAVSNLLSLTALHELRVAPHGNIFAVLFDGNFEASLILPDQLWGVSFRQFVAGDYLIAMPARDVLAFCDRSSATGRTELLELVDRLRDAADHPISNRLFVRRDTEWYAEETA